MIQVQNVSKTFGNTPAVSNVSFKVAGGETLVLLGTSGSGKTTLLKMLNRLITPDSGTIFFNGQNITGMSPEQLRRSMGYVIQHIGLFPHYTVAENIAVVPQLLGWPAARVYERTRHLLERMGLPPAQFTGKYPHELSGGQQQRVGLARALAANPSVILMDEPFGALDPITRHSIRQEFLQLEELSGKTTILVTHDVQEAFILADRICLMDKGFIQQLGRPRDLLLSPANSFVREFFSQNRFQLELMVTRLADVAPYLPRRTEGPENARVFPAGNTLWEVLEASRLDTVDSSLVGIQLPDYVQFAAPEELLKASRVVNSE
jgi:osmoprotectant transport system ATP-binding protein